MPDTKAQDEQEQMILDTVDREPEVAVLIGRGVLVPASRHELQHERPVVARLSQQHDAPSATNPIVGDFEPTVAPVKPHAFLNSLNMQSDMRQSSLHMHLLCF